MIDYNKASVTYDNTRDADDVIFYEFTLKIDLFSAAILDFGCGTGNYLKKIFDSYGNKAYGVEPSDGMREKAIQKNPGFDIRKGDHSKIPFEDAAFDFIYMTDVIHHITDLGLMFSELKRVLKPEGYICITTQSWEQIEARWYNRYFKSLIGNEEKRYPDIPLIADNAGKTGLAIDEVKTILMDPRFIVTKDFIKNVEEKNFSMFHMISEEELNNGIEKMKNDIGKEIISEKAGETLVWIKKNN